MDLISAVVSGSVIFADPVPQASGAVAHILVEEVTRADAAATLAGRLEIPALTLPVGRDSLPFSLSVQGLDPAKRYQLRVHVDVDGDGRVSPGDHVSTESYPVVTQGAPTRIEVRVRRV